MSLGIAFLTPLPTPGVTPSPQFEAMLIARMQEVEAKLVAKVTDADVAMVGGGVAHYGNRPYELAACEAEAPLAGAVYDAANDRWTAAAGGNVVQQGLRVEPGQRLRLVQVHGMNHGVAWTLTVHKKWKATEAISLLGTVSSGTVSGTIEPKSIALSETILDGFCYYLKWTAGAATDRFTGARYEVDRV